MVLMAEFVMCALLEKVKREVPHSKSFDTSATVNNSAKNHNIYLITSFAIPKCQIPIFTRFCQLFGVWVIKGIPKSGNF